MFRHVLKEQDFQSEAASHFHLQAVAKPKSKLESRVQERFFFQTEDVGKDPKFPEFHEFISLPLHPIQVVKNDEIEDLKESLHRGGGVIARKSVGEPLGFMRSKKMITWPFLTFPDSHRQPISVDHSLQGF